MFPVPHLAKPLVGVVSHVYGPQKELKPEQRLKCYTCNSASGLSVVPPLGKVNYLAFQRVPGPLGQTVCEEHAGGFAGKFIGKVGLEMDLFEANTSFIGIDLAAFD